MCWKNCQGLYLVDTLIEPYKTFPKKTHTSFLLKDVLERTHAEMILQGRLPENILEESPEKAHALVSGILLSRQSLQDIAG